MPRRWWQETECRRETWLYTSACCSYHGFRMLKLSNTQLSRHKGTRTILGCTKNTPASVMWCVLGLRAIKERHKLAQFKDYLRVCGDHQHPLHKIWTSYQNKTRARHRFDDTSSAYHWRMQTLCGGNQNGNRYSLQKSERQMYPGNFYTWAWVSGVARGSNTLWKPGSNWGEMQRRWDGLSCWRFRSSKSEIGLGLPTCLPGHDSTDSAGGIWSDQSHHVHHVHGYRGYHWRSDMIRW